MDIKKELDELLRTVIERGASDLHISFGRKPTLRIDGQLMQITGKSVVDDTYVEAFVNQILKFNAINVGKFVSGNNFNISHQKSRVVFNIDESLLNVSTCHANFVK